ncbi:hypothetical protein IJH02_02040 [Candidatus Saccharibacteria bacterium]|nr:hypothetical protein [Candidatus Saccharibacteria bacterium]
MKQKNQRAKRADFGERHEAIQLFVEKLLERMSYHASGKDMKRYNFS